MASRTLTPGSPSSDAALKTSSAPLARDLSLGSGPSSLNFLSSPSRPAAALPDHCGGPTRKIVDLVIELGRALHRHGAPAHRLEGVLSAVAERLGCPGQFFTTPTAIFASFGERSQARTTLVRMPAGGDVDLGRLGELYDWVALVDAGRLDLEEAQRRLDQIVHAPPRFSLGATAAALALASTGAARFFGGGLHDLGAAASIGLALALLTTAAKRGRLGAGLLPALAGLTASLIAASWAAMLPPVSVYVATVAGLIVMMPGLTLTTAMTEISTGHLVSGTTRLTGAAMLLFSLGFGVALGTHLAQVTFGIPAMAEPMALPEWTEWLALATAPLAFGVLFGARFRDFGWIFVASIIGFAGARGGAAMLGPQLGAFLGATLVGIVSNLRARWWRAPATVPQVPGIMLLVPGSVGFRSFSSLLAQDVVSGVDAAFSMVLVAMALVTGLLVANALVPRARTL